MLQKIFNNTVEFFKGVVDIVVMIAEALISGIVLLIFLYIVYGLVFHTLAF